MQTYPLRAIEPAQYDIVFVKPYTKNPSFMNHFAQGSFAVHAPSSPEAPIDWENEDIFLSNKKPEYTAGMLHEILHTLGASDSIMYHNGYGKGAVYYIGKEFSEKTELITPGSENLLYKNVNDIQEEAKRRTGNRYYVGQFQNIEKNLAHELGWGDLNNNGILDVEEACEQNCIIQENGRISYELRSTDVLPYQFCSMR